MTRAVDLCSGVSLLGQHRRADSHALPRRPYGSLVRAFAASGALALSVWSLNLAGGVQERTAASGPAVGTPLSASPNAAPALSGRQGDAPSGTVGPSTLPATIATDPQALVPFPRPALGSYAGDKPLPLSVGAAGLGRPPAGFLRAPLDLLNPSSPFGFRVSPLSGATNDFHLGQDYAAPCGTKVYAADSGVVRAAGWHPWGGGNRVEIDHGSGLITTYNHLEAIAVRTGDRINVGQFIAEVGTTGWSTGCHLHFETILNGRHVNPLTWGLLPVRPLADDGAEELRSFAPGSGSPLGWLQWIIPVSLGPDDHDGQDAAGSSAALASPLPSQATASPGDPSPTPTPTATPAGPTVTPTPTSTPTRSTAPTPTRTPSLDQPTAPTSTTMPTMTPTQTPIPALTPTPTPTQAPIPALTPTPTPTRTPIPALTPTSTPTQAPIPALTPTPAAPDPATVGPPSAAPSPTATEATSPAGPAPASPSIGAACVRPGETHPGNLPRKNPAPTSTLADRQRISPDEQLPEDAACDIPVPDPADPE